MIPRRTVSVCLVAIIVASMLPGTFPVGASGGTFGGGAGTSTDPYVIEDVQDLQNMSADLDAYYVLGNDIDASETVGWDSGAGFAPVGTEADPFTGSLDGGGHIIRGLHINRSGILNVGLLGYVGPLGTVKDVVLASVDVTGVYNVGALVGYNRGAVAGSRVAGDVSGSGKVGGLVGWNDDVSTVSGSDAAGNVSGYGDYFGGLVGYDRGTVSGCHADVAVAVEGDYVGGLVGAVVYGTVSGSYAMGDVAGTINVGGLVGTCTDGMVSGSHAAGGVSGFMGVGGLVGSSFQGTVSGSYATGDVSGTGNHVGGLVGANGRVQPADESIVSDCYATGDVATTGDYVGGLVGFNRATVADSYSTGKVGRSSTSGGLVGTNYGGVVDDCFWDNETSGLIDSEGGTGLTTAEMRIRSTFIDAGWDFVDVWFIIEDVTYPCLRSQDAKAPTADAGPNQTVALGTNGKVEVVLDGNGSTDDFGLLDHMWTFDHDDPPVPLHGATVEFTFERPGVYIATLTVTDATGHEGTDAMTVTVSDVNPPTVTDAALGPYDEDTMVTFDLRPFLSDNDPDFLATGTVDWTLTDPTGRTFELSGLAPVIELITPGTWRAAIVVGDASGNTAEDELYIDVRDTTPPTARANAHPAGTDEDADVSWDATPSTDNDPVFPEGANFTWALTRQGAVTDDVVMLYGVKVTHAFETPGTYLVVLTVRDTGDNTATWSETLVVRDITPPEVPAMTDRVVAEDVIVAFEAPVATDNDPAFPAGAVYTWRIQSLYGGSYTLHGQSPSFSFAAPDVYEVTVDVTDAAGNMGFAVFNVTVLDTTAPRTASDLRIKGDASEKATITWIAPGDADLAGFVILRQEGDDPWVEVANLTGAGITTYTDKDLSPGKTYHYKVEAYDDSGNKGVPGELTYQAIEPMKGGYFPWWVVVITFIIGMMVALLVEESRIRGRMRAQEKAGRPEDEQ